MKLCKTTRSMEVTGVWERKRIDSVVFHDDEKQEDTICLFSDNEEGCSSLFLLNMYLFFLLNSFCTDGSLRWWTQLWVRDVLFLISSCYFLSFYCCTVLLYFILCEYFVYVSLIFQYMPSVLNVWRLRWKTVKSNSL